MQPGRGEAAGMPNPLRSPRVDLIAWDQEVFFLQSDAVLSGHGKVRAWVWGETVHPYLNVLEEISQTPGPGASWGRPWVEEMQGLVVRLGRPPLKHWYRAELDGPEPFRPYLEILLEPAPHQGVEHRRSPRLEHHFRVMSNDLPDLRATVRDISDSGLGLDLVGPLQRGARISLRLEPDDGAVRPFPVQAEVCWCRPSKRTAAVESRAGMAAGTHLFEAGARFIDLDQDARSSLNAYLERLQGLENGTFSDHHVR